jgi:hypothetical protein
VDLSDTLQTEVLKYNDFFKNVFILDASVRILINIIERCHVDKSGHL